MQTQMPTTPTQNQVGVEDPQRRLLLVRCSSQAEAEITSTVPGSKLVLATSLIEALEHLRAKEFDLVLLGTEIRIEEQALFCLEARRRGYAGPVLHVVSTLASQVPQQSFSLPEAATQITTLEQVGRKFTARQLAVLLRVSNGKSNLQIALDLGCSEGSVKATLQQLFNKLGVRRRAQIVRVAFERGLPPSLMK